MDVFEAIKKRRSIRKFSKSKQVTEEQIEKLLETASWAPSAGNLQSYFFYVVRDQKIKDKLVEAANSQEFIGEASVVFAACADSKQASYYGERGKSLYCIQDATIALVNVWLAATEMGLGGVWVGAFDEEEVSEILGLASYHRPVAILPIGYPAESPSPPSRQPIIKISKRL
jgi:nitroreductase